MIFRQIFDSVSSTYTYLIASRSGGEALLIDPVLEKTDQYLRLMEQLDLQLVKVIDTHVHADHVTAMGALRDHTNCVTVMGEQSPVDVVSMRVTDGERVTIEGINLTALYTPGHTDDSYCFQMDDRIFTGDTLLIRGTGRTDFKMGMLARNMTAYLAVCYHCQNRHLSIQPMIIRARLSQPLARKKPLTRACKSHPNQPTLN